MAQIKDSILQDVKQTLGQEWDDNSFDLDVMMAVNSVFFNLNMIGVGPPDGFTITDDATLWNAYIGASKNLESVKSYIYLRTRLIFDPPTNGFLVTSLENQANKLEWLLMVLVDPPVAPSQLGEINE